MQPRTAQVVLVGCAQAWVVAAAVAAVPAGAWLWKPSTEQATRGLWQQQLHSRCCLHCLCGCSRSSFAGHAACGVWS